MSAAEQALRPGQRERIFIHCRLRRFDFAPVPVPQRQREQEMPTPVVLSGNAPPKGLCSTKNENVGSGIRMAFCSLRSAADWFKSACAASTSGRSALVFDSSNAGMARAAICASVSPGVQFPAEAVVHPKEFPRQCAPARRQPQPTSPVVQKRPRCSRSAARPNWTGRPPSNAVPGNFHLVLEHFGGLVQDALVLAGEQRRHVSLGHSLVQQAAGIVKTAPAPR